MASRHPTPTSILRNGRAPRSYGALSPNHSTPPSEPSDILPPYSPIPAAPGPVRPPGLESHPTGETFQKRTSIVISRGVAICFAIILLQSVLIICRSDALARYIDLDSAASRASKERSTLMVEREKSERERMRSEQERERLGRERAKWELEREELRRDMDELDLERIEFRREMELARTEFEQEMEQQRTELKQEMNELDLERMELKREKIELEQERRRWEQEEQKWRWERGEWETDKGKWELEKGKWEQERREWESEREKLELEREKLRLEREWWQRAREDRIPQGAFWEVVWPAWDCRAYGKREYWGTLRSIPEGWTAVDACMNMPVEIKSVTVRRPDRCAFVEGSPLIHGYWVVDWDQPDCRPWYRNYQDVGCTSYGSGQRRIEAELVGINKRGGQDWWLLCSTTPLVWNQITYTSPTHCEERGRRKMAMWDVPDESCR